MSKYRFILLYAVLGILFISCNDWLDVNPETEQKEKEQEEIDAAMDQLYQMMKEYIDKSGKNVEITKGDGGVFLSFADAVFFDADKS